MNIENVIFLYWCIFIISIFIALYGYKAKVLNTLREYGYDDVEKGLPSNQFKQIKEYKEVCIKNGLSLKWYKFIAAYPIIGSILIMGGVVLIICSDLMK